MEDLEPSSSDDSALVVESSEEEEDSSNPKKKNKKQAVAKEVAKPAKAAGGGNKRDRGTKQGQQMEVVGELSFALVSCGGSKEALLPGREGVAGACRLSWEA